MTDRYMKVILTIIAINLTVISTNSLLSKAIPKAWAQDTMDVRIVGGTLDYETDVKGGPTLKVCIDC